MDDGQEPDFLRRWSRLKQQSRSNSGALDPEPQAPAAVPAQSGEAGDRVGGRAGPVDEAPAVPPIESLDIESDYRAFFHPKIEEGLRRAALKKLFGDPHFNVMDGLDVYIDDYSVSDPLPTGMLEQLEQAKKIFAWSREDAEERAKAEARKHQETEAGAESPDIAAMPQADTPSEPAPPEQVSGARPAADGGPAHRVE